MFNLTVKQMVFKSQLTKKKLKKKIKNAEI